ELRDGRNRRQGRDQGTAPGHPGRAAEGQPQGGQRLADLPGGRPCAAVSRMNRYPTWKYLLILAAVLLGLIYSLPNLFGEDPAIHVSARTAEPEPATLARVEEILRQADIPYLGARFDETGTKVRFADTETQLRARDLVQKELGNAYTVALNLIPATPGVLRALNAEPMNLGLDLRGGVHFLMQVDMSAVLEKAIESAVDDLRRTLRENG